MQEPHLLTLLEYALVAGVSTDVIIDDKQKLDMHGPTGIITDEIRVLSPTSGELNQFLVKP